MAGRVTAACILVLDCLKAKRSNPILDALDLTPMDLHWDVSGGAVDCMRRRYYKPPSLYDWLPWSCLCPWSTMFTHHDSSTGNVHPLRRCFSFLKGLTIFKYRLSHWYLAIMFPDHGSLFPSSKDSGWRLIVEKEPLQWPDLNISFLAWR